MIEGFKKLDTWLIENPYQGVVNLTGKQPVWWVEQCGFVLLVFGLARFYFEDRTAADYIVLVSNLMVAGMLFFFSRIPSMIKHIMGDIKLRMFLMILFPIGISHAFSLPLMSGLAKAFTEIAFLSAYYFAVCNPPPPPKRKHKLVEAAS